jgi:hypothetical protein
MADFIDPSSVSDGSGPSPMSMLNRLPTKRLDAAITEAATTGIPIQGAQSGGYAPQFQHLSHISLLPLYSDKQHELLAQKQKVKERLVEHMDRNDPDKVLSSGQKTFLNVVGHLSGGGSVVNTKRWERRLMGANVYTSNMVMRQDKLIVFTRWTPVTHRQRETAPWFVDVIEHRFHPDCTSSMKSMGGNAVALKVGIGGSIAGIKKVTLKLLKTEAKGLKTQTTWNKRMNNDPCEEISYVGEEGVVAMEIVARIERACSSLEANELCVRFNKEWLVPLVQ